MDNRITLYVSSPYSYKDIFDAFYKCYSMFWKNPSIPFVLSTNYQANYDGIKVISSGDLNDGWVDRSLNALQQVDSKYILLMCDDLFINKEINESQVLHIVEVMERYNLNFCRLNPSKDGVVLEGEQNLLHLYKTTPYAKNLQIGIFNREYLINTIKEGNRSAWDIESDWQQESIKSDRVLFEDVIGVKISIISYIHGVWKGTLYPGAVKKLEKLGIHIDGDRPLMSKKKELLQEIKIFTRALVSPRTRYRLKYIISMVGIKFSSNY